MMQNKEFAVFILTHGRPDSQSTYKSLMRCNYSGPLYFIIDNEDKTADRYRELYGEQVIMFDKKKVSRTFDNGDNFEDRRAIVFARNAVFKIARELGFKYFLQLDDDYVKFQYRFNSELKYDYHAINNLDPVFDLLLRYYISVPSCQSLAMAQGGDFIGGSGSENSGMIQLKRKCMNTFFCSVDRPFQFTGRINEDVNTYTRGASAGMLFFTFNAVAIVQRQTQTNKGGMTDIYLNNGTYIKSFYTVMYQPSSVRISIMRTENPRIHHKISWANTVPCILRETVRKERKTNAVTSTELPEGTQESPAVLHRKPTRKPGKKTVTA